MTRREFLKGMGAFVLLLGADWKSLAKVEKALACTAQNAVGPLLREGLSVKPSEEGASVFYQEKPVFQVNHSGTRLLGFANGMYTLDEIISLSDNVPRAAQVAMFFVTLGQAGYLENRVEVALLEYPA